MSMDNNSKDRPTDPAVIRDLYRAGLLTGPARDTALRLLRPARAWWTWANRIMLFLGAALVLSGIVFFFAYNWARMGRFTKFGLIEAGILVCLIGAHRLKYHSLAGKVLLLSASVLTGSLLAVYGQIYQTGADAYELFVGWAALILGWVLIARFAGLWLFWLVIVNTAAILYWGQVAESNYNVCYEALCLALALVNAAFLSAREIGILKNREWLAGVWLRDVLLLAVLTYLMIPGIGLIVDEADNTTAGLLALVAFLAAVSGGYYAYRSVFGDLRALAYITLAICILVLTAIGRGLFEISEDAPVYLLFGLIILGTMSLATLGLRRIGRTLAEERSGQR